MRRLWDAYCFPGFRPEPTVRGVFGDPKVRVIRLNRRSKTLRAAATVMSRWAGTTAGSAGCATYVEAQLKRAGTPGPRAIGVDEIAIRKGHSYRMVVSDLDRGRPIWFGRKDRSEPSMSQ